MTPFLLVASCLFALTGASSLGNSGGYEFNEVKAERETYLLLSNQPKQECVLIPSTNGWVQYTMKLLTGDALRRTRDHVIKMYTSHGDEAKPITLSDYIGDEANKYCTGCQSFLYQGTLNGQDITTAGEWQLVDFTRGDSPCVLAVGEDICYAMTDYVRFITQAYGNNEAIKGAMEKKLTSPNTQPIDLATAFPDADKSQRCAGKKCFRVLSEQSSRSGSSRRIRRVRRINSSYLKRQSLFKLFGRRG